MFRRGQGDREASAARLGQVARRARPERQPECSPQAATVTARARLQSEATQGARQRQERMVSLAILGSRSLSSRRRRFRRDLSLEGKEKRSFEVWPRPQDDIFL